MTADIKSAIRREAEAARLCVAARDGAATPSARPANACANSSQAGRHGDMAWIADTAERRRHPSRLWPEVAIRLMLAMSYAPTGDPLAGAGQCRPRRHLGLRPREPRLPRHPQGQAQGARREPGEQRTGAEVKVFVDTAPLMEKPLAAAAGLGWQGKHTNLVSREHGSWLFLGAILTTAELDPDAPRGRSLRLLPALPRRLPDDAFPDALRARCAPLPRLPDDRAQGSHPGRVPRADGQPRVRLRRLPRRLPVEQVRGAAREATLRCARGDRQPAACRAARARRRAPSARASPARPSSAPAATASCATC